MVTPCVALCVKKEGIVGLFTCTNMPQMLCVKYLDEMQVLAQMSVLSAYDQKCRF